MNTLLFTRTIIWFSLALIWPLAVCADYKDDIGYTLLLSELGENIPDGNGVHVTHVEALSSDMWIPNLANGEFTGKSFQELSTGHPEGYSGHANSVGRLFYGNTSSIAPGITQVDLYTAGYGSDHSYWPPPPWQWMGRGFLWAGWSIGGNPVQPLYNGPETHNCSSVNVSSPSRIANHSWVASISTSDILRRVDWVIDTDEYMQAVASHTTAALLSSAFNVVAVGRTAGESAAGSPAIDSVYTGGRPLSNLVAPVSSLSGATPIVAAAMALLVETGMDPSLSNDPAEQWTYNRDGEVIYNAERSEVMKAALMAGADRFTQNTSTTDNIEDYGTGTYTSVNGLDSRYGAGQVNIRNSYHIIAAGEQNSDEDDLSGTGEISWEGFDFDPAFGITGGISDSASYFFTSDDTHCRLAASLVWNIKIDGGSCLNFNNSATLYDLNLYLYDVTDIENPVLIASSEGNAANTENLWVGLQKNRDYRMEVRAEESQGDFTWDFALAWRIIADGDRDNMADCWELEYALDPEDPNDGDEDADSDDLTNLEEFETGTDPIDADTDDDGATDGAEKIYWVQNFGTWLNDYDEDGEENNLLDRDADGDNRYDGFEIVAGSDPSDPADYPEETVPALSVFSLIIVFSIMIFIALFRNIGYKRHPHQKGQSN